MKVDSTSIVVAGKGQLASTVGSETVILGVQEGRYYGVNAVGARIWQMIQTPMAVADIRDALVAEYAVDAQRCEADLIRLIDQMAEVRLVEIHSDAPS